MFGITPESLAGMSRPQTSYANSESCVRQQTGIARRYVRHPMTNPDPPTVLGMFTEEKEVTRTAANTDKVTGGTDANLLCPSEFSQTY